VHVEAKKFAAEGYTIVLIGHEGHEEVEGTMGEAPEAFVLVETEEDVDRLELPDPDRVAYLTQTTLSVDETDRIIRRLRERFPNITGPKSDDICYATTNRQMAVRQMARECDLVLVIGSRNSSNSNRLVEVARDHGAASYLIDNETQVREEARRRNQLGRQRTRGARAAAGGLLPRARHRRRVRVPGRPGGRALHAPEGDSPGAGGAGVNCTPCRRSPGESA
jgi:(E)-4-hydroxy-3-methyl-but-2-enyl pyrophosphate reductase